MYYDILVVGAGPAGSSAALAAAQHGAKVLVVEKRRTIGQPVQCAEFIPKLLWKETAAGSNSIAQEVKNMRIYFPGGKCYEVNSPGYILNRTIFDKELAIAATKSGVQILINTICLSKDDEKIVLRKNSKEITVSAKVIIGADGPKSTVGRWIKEVNKEFIITLQFEMALVKPMDWVEVYFHKDFFSGYAWVFPKKESANVGVGIKLRPDSQASLHKILETFVQRLYAENKVRSSPISITNGLIPVGGPVRTVKKNFLLVGDAAGQTHPITGAGIPQAIICGKIAGRIAARVIKEKKCELLYEYEKEWQSIFGEELKRAQTRRRFLVSNWNNLDKILKRCWVTFSEYYE